MTCQAQAYDLCSYYLNLLQFDQSGAYYTKMLARRHLSNLIGSFTLRCSMDITCVILLTILYITILCVYTCTVCYLIQHVIFLCVYKIASYLLLVLQLGSHFQLFLYSRAIQNLISSPCGSFKEISTIELNISGCSPITCYLMAYNCNSHGELSCCWSNVAKK